MPTGSGISLACHSAGKCDAKEANFVPLCDPVNITQ